MLSSLQTYCRFVAPVLALAGWLWQGRRRLAFSGGWVYPLALMAASCSLPAGEEESAGDPPQVGTVSQALDSDSDGLDDAWETTNFGNLAQTGGGDPDADDMTNSEEYLNGFNPNVKDALNDADGDRYPNIFELRNGGAPTNAAVVPTATYTVNGAGGGTHTTISAAMNAATVANGAYQIIAIAPGTYTGAANLRDVTIASTKPKLLIIGTQGAAKTIIDGGATNWGWILGNTAVVSSLTFRNMLLPIYVDAAAGEARIVDVLIRDNVNPVSWAGGVHVNNAARVSIVGSTFLDNAGPAAAQQIWIGAGAGTVTNTLVWSQATGTMLANAGGTTLTTNYCLVKGQTLTGTGNLAGTTVPKYRTDGHLLWDSPLRAAGGTSGQSRIDIDGELRPATTPDIGVDQFLDSDADGLADKWEVDQTGGLTALTSRTQDADTDGLTNDAEYLAGTKPNLADTDGDGLSDGAEVNTQGTNPLKTDTDGDDMPDGWEVTYAISPLIANGFEDADGDRYPNVFEYARATNPASSASVPTANYTVNGAGGGTHTTVSAAVAAATVANGAYQIIAIAPGTYTGAANLRDVTVDATKPKLLFIGLQGAGKTIIDGGLANYGWLLNNTAVIASLTFQKAAVAAYVDAPAQEVRFVDLIVRDNIGPSWAAGVHVNAASKVYITGSTFLDNTGATAAQQIWGGAGTLNLANTVVHGAATGTMLANAAGTTLVTNNCLVKGQPLTGTGNLAGTTNPKLRSDARLLWDSPLRGAGGSVLQSRIDIDGELRPATGRDIGVDQFLDSDADGLADKWEVDEAGNLTTLTSRAQDADGDGLNNELEYANYAKPTVADTDGDGLSDGAEVNTQGTNPRKTDTDGDDMPDGWEVTYGLAPLVANGFEDADGDRYPNVFEYARSTNPASAASIPAANYTVNGAGGGTHTTVGAAVASAILANGAYQIIGIAPGTYKGVANLRDVTTTTAKPKLLFIGLQGAAKTIIDGELLPNNYGWMFQNAAVVSSLTFRGATVAHYVDAPGQEVRFVDLLVRDNVGPTWAAGVHVNAGAKVFVTGSTFLDNKGAAAAQQVWGGAGALTLTNTLVGGKLTGIMLASAAGTTLTTNNCFVKGQTLTGTGNLAGSVDPKLRTDAHLRSDSPLRGVGGNPVESRVDMDGELRPATGRDIGVDQFVDADADGLPDAWEIANYGSTGGIAGAADADSDGLSNATELNLETNMLDPDTDKDHVWDGLEVTLGLNPLVADADDLTGDLNHDGVIDIIGAQLGYQPDKADDDGDGVTNTDELLMCTNPLRTDSDGDGVPDSTDAFPLDPRVTTLPAPPSDVTPPVITLTSPWYAVPL